jgi:hypothetical protein
MRLVARNKTTDVSSGKRKGQGTHKQGEKRKIRKIKVLEIARCNPSIGLRVSNLEITLQKSAAV